MKNSFLLKARIDKHFSREILSDLIPLLLCQRPTIQQTHSIEQILKKSRCSARKNSLKRARHRLNYIGTTETSALHLQRTQRNQKQEDQIVNEAGRHID